MLFIMKSREEVMENNSCFRNHGGGREEREGMMVLFNSSGFLPGKDSSSLQGKGGKQNLKAKMTWKQLKECDEQASSHSV